MATITGRVIFDRDRSAAVSSGDSGISGVPVVLQNVLTERRLTVLTNSNGNYTFTNVPAGSYRIVLSYGQSGGVPSPGNFTQAAIGPIPTGVNPPVSAVSNPPTGTTNLDSITPSTRLITVSDDDLEGQNFLVGPVIYTPIGAILDPCTEVEGTNLITVASRGTFGNFSPGTAANTGAPTVPYPGVTPDFTYVLPNPEEYTPGAGQYTVQNLLTNARSNEIGAWWRIADHTTGTETGRMMIINGDRPGAVFFRQVVEVEPNTDYLLTAWILNLFKVTGYPDPRLGVRILDQEGRVLYSQTLGPLIPVSTAAPEWKEIGTVINSRNNESITVEFISEGQEEIGNDYAIDDISLQEITLPSFIPEKRVSDSNLRVGESTEFTVTLHNSCHQPLTDLIFRDNLPEGLVFVPGSVEVNGQIMPGSNPETGFSLPDVAGGATVTVRFTVRAESVPSENPAINRAEITYSYTPVEGGIPLVFPVVSNPVSVTIAEDAEADVGITKTSEMETVEPGDTLNYTITVTNYGPSAAEMVRFTDAVPGQLTDPRISRNGGQTFTNWTGEEIIGTLAAGASRTFILRGTVSAGALQPLVNTAHVSAATADPNPANNQDTVIVEINSPRGQALTDLIESIALQEAALSHILNAEGEKMQAMLSMEEVTADQLLELNRSVNRLIGSVTRLETVLQAKLKSVIQ